MRIVGVTAAVMVLGACASGVVPAASELPTQEEERTDHDQDHEDLPAAPWSAARLSVAEVPPVFVREWTEAENRTSCALIALAATEPGASARAASFSGGWAVAYDMAGQRSAFGVAGTGVSADGDVYDGWPNAITWDDGSYADYGPEGGTGPNQLAYLVIVGQDCLYNVWSRLGVEHLESLLGQLRFVR